MDPAAADPAGPEKISDSFVWLNTTLVVRKLLRDAPFPPGTSCKCVRCRRKYKRFVWIDVCVCGGANMMFGERLSVCARY